MALGSVFLGGVADKIGRRPTILGCLVVMATGMFMVTQSTGVLGWLVTPIAAMFDYKLDNRLVDLAAWRVITGLGIGGMLAAINAVAAEFSNREAARPGASRSCRSAIRSARRSAASSRRRSAAALTDWRSCSSSARPSRWCSFRSSLLLRARVRALARAQAAARRARKDQPHADAASASDGRGAARRVGRGAQALGLRHLRSRPASRSRCS